MNNTLGKSDKGDEVLGAWLLSGSARAGEILSRTALDWIGIDMEHAPNSPGSVEDLIRAIERQATPLARIPSVEVATTGTTKQVLDAGAQGVIIPDVDTAEKAKRVVQAANFPPTGERGAAGTVRANAYGVNFDDYIATANSETLVVVQIESPAAVERAEEILAVDGVDVAFIGENDLSTKFGHPGKTDHPEVKAAVEHVFEAAKAHDVYTGIAGRTSETMDERADRGFRFFLLGADLSFMRMGLETFLTD